MKTIQVASIKAMFTWKADNPPKIDPLNAVIEVVSGDLRVIARISPKNARKLLAHGGAGKIERRLAIVGGKLELIDASAQMFDPRPATAADG